MRATLALLLFATTGVTLLAQAPAVRTPLPVPDIPGFRTLKGDFHLHTVFSDGNVWPTVHVYEAWRDGLDVIALTEHAEYHPHRADVKVDAARSYEIARPLAEQLGLILIPGIEITKPDPYTAPPVLPGGSQHFNALFVTDANALNVPDLMEALRRARAQNAFVFWNHPRFRVDRAEWFPAVARAHEAGLFGGMELVNGPDFYEEAYPWIDERQLTILATSDAHDPIPPRSTGHRRPITLLFVRSADAAGVREALEARRTAAWLGDQVWGPEVPMAGLWRAAVRSGSARAAAGRRNSSMLQVENVSAIPFRVRTRRAPDWLSLPAAFELPPEATTRIPVAVSAQAPPGSHALEIDVEVVNLHVGPDRSLHAVLPLQITLR